MTAHLPPRSRLVHEALRGVGIPGDIVVLPDAAATAPLAAAALGVEVGATGHPAPLTTIVDEDLAAYAEIWAAGGTAHTVFPLTFDELVRLTGGTVAKVD